MIKLGTYQPEFDSYGDRAITITKGYMDYFIYPGRLYDITTPVGKFTVRAVEYRDITGLVTVGFWVPFYGLFTLRINAKSGFIYSVE